MLIPKFAAPMIPLEEMMNNSTMTTSSADQEPVLVNSEVHRGTRENMNNTKTEAQVDATESGKLKETLATERERYLRLAADFDNFKKRTARESERRALEHRDAFIRELLPVVDNLERALAGDSCTSQAALRDGVKLILQQLFLLLRKHGLESELSLGQQFDPHRHEAVRTRTNPEFANNSVLEVWQRGWRRGGELFHPAKVVVNDLNPPQADQGS